MKEYVIATDSERSVARLFDTLAHEPQDRAIGVSTGTSPPTSGPRHQVARAGQCPWRLTGQPRGQVFLHLVGRLQRL